MQQRWRRRRVRANPRPHAATGRPQASVQAGSHAVLLPLCQRSRPMHAGLCLAPALPCLAKVKALAPASLKPRPCASCHLIGTLGTLMHSSRPTGRATACGPLCASSVTLCSPALPASAAAGSGASSLSSSPDKHAVHFDLSSGVEGRPHFKRSLSMAELAAAELVREEEVRLQSQDSVEASILVAAMAAAAQEQQQQQQERRGGS